MKSKEQNNKKENKIVDLMFTMNRLTKEGMEHGFNSLPFTQAQTLSFIYRKKSSTIKEISEHLRITPPSVTSLLDNLSKLKLIKRVRDSKDRRSVRVSLTPAGEEELQKNYDSAKKCLEKRLAFLSEEDKKEFLRILTKLSDLFDQKSN